MLLVPMSLSAGPWFCAFRMQLGLGAAIILEAATTVRVLHQEKLFKTDLSTTRLRKNLRASQSEEFGQRYSGLGSFDRGLIGVKVMIVD